MQTIIKEKGCVAGVEGGVGVFFGQEGGGNKLESEINRDSVFYK